MLENQERQRAYEPAEAQFFVRLMLRAGYGTKAVFMGIVKHDFDLLMAIPTEGDEAINYHADPFANLLASLCTSYPTRTARALLAHINGVGSSDGGQYILFAIIREVMTWAQSATFELEMTPRYAGGSANDEHNVLIAEYLNPLEAQQMMMMLGRQEYAGDAWTVAQALMMNTINCGGVQFASYTLTETSTHKGKAVDF